MTTTPPTLKADFDQLAQTLSALKKYNDEIVQSIEPAQGDVNYAQELVENILGRHEWFCRNGAHEEGFDKMKNQLTMAQVVLYDLSKNQDIIDKPGSTEDAIEEAETTIAFRKDYFKTHIEGAEDLLFKLYEQGKTLAGRWEEISDFKQTTAKSAWGNENASRARE